MPPLAATEVGSYAPVLLLIIMAITFAVANVVLSRIFGPRREGNIKATTYESGMDPVGTARKRFNVRFYLIAMIFLVFDIEIIFLYPWAATFPNIDHSTDQAMIWLARIFFFMLTTVIAYIYGYRKGVFKFD
ncbi:MAG: NADH-quinone oxidoreductase subunit A [Phycisphaerales bacterium]|nr:NADH-quinone oxidoreductase subunit A [Phycisphaerales bacterium]